MNKLNIRIDTEGITDEQKTTEKFQSAHRDMLTQLTAPGFILVLCSHEAAHLVYFNLLGVMSFDIFPPRLRYEPLIDDYVGHLAAVQPLNIPVHEQGKFWKWLFKIACAHAAGGVVARKKMPSSDGGDQDDKNRFKKLCDAFNQEPNIFINFEEWWSSAQKQVTADVEIPQNMASIDEHAVKLRSQFGL